MKQRKNESKTSQKQKYVELEYIMLDVKFDVEFDPEFFDEKEQEELKQYINIMSKRIYIDKSYVEFKGNKRKSTFMLEEGWDALKHDVVVTNFCKRPMPSTENAALVDAFSTIARCYIYECLALKTEHFAHINCTINENQQFNIIICQDVGRDFENYIGPWQDWEFDDKGKFVKVNNIDKDKE